MAFLDLARAIGVRELPERRVPSSPPPPERESASADSPTSAAMHDWINGIERGEFDAVCEEINASQKNSERD